MFDLVIKRPLSEVLHDIVILLKLWDNGSEEEKLVLAKYILLSEVQMVEGIASTLQSHVKLEELKKIKKELGNELDKRHLKAPEWIKYLSSLLFLRKKNHINFDEPICQSILNLYNQRNVITHPLPITSTALDNQNTHLPQPAMIAELRTVFAFLDIFLVEWCGGSGDHLTAWLCSEGQYNFGHYSKSETLTSNSFICDKEYIESRLNIKVLFLDKILESELMAKSVKLNSNIASHTP